MEKEIKVKQGWNDITVLEYEQLADIESHGEEYKDVIDKGSMILHALYGVDGMQIAYTDFQRLMATLNFMKERPKPNKAKAIYKINEIELTLDFEMTSFTTAQYVDFENFRKDNDVTGMLSVVLVPKGKLYNKDYDMKAVKEAIEMMPITDALGILDFFLAYSRKFALYSLRYLTRRLKRMMKKTKMTKEAKRDLQNQIRELNTAFSHIFSATAD